MKTKFKVVFSCFIAIIYCVGWIDMPTLDHLLKIEHGMVPDTTTIWNKITIVATMIGTFSLFTVFIIIIGVILTPKSTIEKLIK